MTPESRPLSPGDVVSGLDPAELVEVQRISPFGKKTLIEGVGVSSRRVIQRPLGSEELDRLVKVRGHLSPLTATPRSSFLESKPRESGLRISSIRSSRSTPALLIRSRTKSKPSIVISYPCRAFASSWLTTRAPARQSWPGS